MHRFCSQRTPWARSPDYEVTLFCNTALRLVQTSIIHGLRFCISEEGLAGTVCFLMDLRLRPKAPGLKMEGFDPLLVKGNQEERTTIFKGPLL